MITQATLAVLALTAATFITSILDAVEAAQLPPNPVAVARVANLPHIAGLKLPSQLRYVGGVGHTATALPLPPPRCDKPKLPLPGCKIPHA
jgi:hypothetical protein